MERSISFAIAGPFLSACLPHALALTLVVSPGLRRWPLAALASALAVGELSWHLYLTGRTVFVVFLLAALLERVGVAVDLDAAREVLEAGCWTVHTVEISPNSAMSET